MANLKDGGAFFFKSRLMSGTEVVVKYRQTYRMEQ